MLPLCIVKCLTWKRGRRGSLEAAVKARMKDPRGSSVYAVRATYVNSISVLLCHSVSQTGPFFCVCDLPMNSTTFDARKYPGCWTCSITTRQSGLLCCVCRLVSLISQQTRHLDARKDVKLAYLELTMECHRYTTDPFVGR